MSGDPRWLTAKWPGKCSAPKCGKPIAKGERVFYYPNGKRILCPACGEQGEREFTAAAFDDAQQGGGW